MHFILKCWFLKFYHFRTIFIYFLFMYVFLVSTLFHKCRDFQFKCTIFNTKTKLHNSYTKFIQILAYKLEPHKIRCIKDKFSKDCKIYVSIMWRISDFIKLELVQMANIKKKHKISILKINRYISKILNIRFISILMVTAVINIEMTRIFYT